MKSFLTFLFALSFFGLAFSPLQVSAREPAKKGLGKPNSPVAVVKSTGQGVTPETAEKAALTRAIVKAVGALVEQEVLVKNDELIRDEIFSVSSGFVKSFKVVRPAKKNREGEYEVVLEVVVEKRKLEESLAEKGLVTATANTKNVWAETFSKNVTSMDAVRMLETKLPSLIERLFSVSFFEKNPEPVLLAQDSSKGTAFVLWWVKLSSDPGFWYSKVAPMFDTCFSAIQENELNDVSVERGQVPNVYVAVSKPPKKSFLNSTDLKSFYISKNIFQKIKDLVGFPLIRVNVKAGDELVKSEAFYANAECCDLAQFFQKMRLEKTVKASSFHDARLNADQRNNRTVTISQPRIEKFINSKPEKIPHGHLLFSGIFDVERPWDSKGCMARTEGLRGGMGYRYPEVNYLTQHPDHSLPSFYIPEPIIDAASFEDESTGKAGGKTYYRRPVQGAAVAFPIIVELPSDELKNNLVLEIRITRASKVDK